MNAPLGARELSKSQPARRREKNAVVQDIGVTQRRLTQRAAAAAAGFPAVALAGATGVCRGPRRRRLQPEPQRPRVHPRTDQGRRAARRDRITTEPLRHVAWQRLRTRSPTRCFPYGLRTVDGSCNNLLPGGEDLGRAQRLMPRLADPVWREGEDSTRSRYRPGGTHRGARPTRRRAAPSWTRGRGWSATSWSTRPRPTRPRSRLPRGLGAASTTSRARCRARRRACRLAAPRTGRRC